MNNIFWFFIFLSVPILVHLFNFRKAKKVFFTNVQFIQKIATETKSKARLKHILILTARALAFVFIILTFILAFTDRNSELKGSTSYDAFYLDNSISSYGNGIDEKIRIVESIISVKETEAYLLTNDFSSFSNHHRSKAEILNELNTINVSYVTRSLTEVINRMDESADIFLMSDFNLAKFSDLEKIRADTSRNYHFIFDKTTKKRNVFIDSVWMERAVDDYSFNNLKCILDQTDDTSGGRVIVKLLDENGTQISSIVKNLDENVEVMFSIPRTQGDLFYKIQLSGDQVEYDNEFYFLIVANEVPEVLIISQTPNKYLSHVFGNEELFSVTVSNAGRLDYEKIQRSDLIVLNDYFSLPEGLMKQNSEKISFLVIPADSIDIENYQNETGLSITYETEDVLLETYLNVDNPLIKGIFEKLTDGTNLPKADSKYRLLGAHESILSLRGGGTLLGKGVGTPVYFMTTPLDDNHTELQNHSIFLPLMYRIAEKSVASNQKLFSYPNDFVEIPEITLDVPPRIVSNDLEIIPEFTLGNKESLVKIPDELAPGFYSILQGEDTVQSFGLNIPKTESQFSGVSLEEISKFFSGSDHVRIISLGEESENILLAISDKSDVWKYALILALGSILIETVLHRYLK